MHGKPIEVAKEALKLFIKSLPIGSYFNVYSFGSEFEKLFESPMLYTQENLDSALQKIETFDADLGGTEIYQPLDSIFKTESNTGLQRHVYLLTDGCVGDID